MPADLLRDTTLDDGTPNLRVAVGIATTGRAAILGETLDLLLRQSLPPSSVFLLYSQGSDIAGLPERFPTCRFHQSAGGSCEKRNWVIDAAADTDLLFFMDDDFLLHRDYLSVMEAAFRGDPALVASTGLVLADGARGPGLSVEQGMAWLAQAEGGPRGKPEPAFNTYGCNMAFRAAAVREHGIRFDEHLPAYAWYEDIDFSRRLARFGTMQRLPGAMGVHLGAKVGRVSGLRLGYSQVANPIYLSRKGSYPWSHAVRSVGRNAVSNLLRSVAPEPYVDRRGRLRGNLLAFGDLLRGRLRPDRILDLR